MTDVTATLLVNGRWRQGQPDRDHCVANPATGVEVGRVSFASRQDTHDAIEAATRSGHDWARMPARERGGILNRAANLLEERADVIAHLLSRETGKLPAEARGEVGLSGAFLRWFAEEGRRARGETISTPSSDKRAAVIPQPVGVVAVVTPWNFPVSIQARKLAPALAAGCTVVTRPSEVAPLAAVEFIRCLQEAGLPPGVLNLITGTVEDTSNPVLADPRVRMVTFTGSTRVGQIVASAAAGTMARTTLELGGDAPFIVFDDADLDLALEQAEIAKYRNNGQSCIAMNRLLLHESIADEFLDRFVERSRVLEPGDPANPNTSLGPVISAEARDQLQRWLTEARDGGGTVLLGEDQPADTGGHFVAPAIVRDPPSDSGLAREEVFGPVVGVWTFADESEALQLANRNLYGLAAYVCSDDLGRVSRVAEGLHAGIVGINDAGPTTPEAPFGGIGLSGHGKEGGHQGLAEFLDYKYISTRLPNRS